MTADVVTGSQNIPYQLSIKDNDFDLTYYLSSEDLIPTAPKINEPEQYDVEFDIDEDFIKNFIKAHNALDKPNYFTIECKVENEEKFIELCVGDSASYANKIKLRQNAEFTFGVDKMPFSAKFGACVTTVGNLTEYAKVKGQHISGVSFHVGSGGGDVSQYYVALKQASHALCKLNIHFRDARTIDIGGGMTEESFHSVARIVKNSIGNLPSNTVLIAEPGRFMANRSQDLFVKVIGKKPSTKGNGFRYTLDESLYGQFSCIPYDHATPKWIRVSQSAKDVRKRVPAVLYGRTCDSVDLIAVAEDAEELFPGDWLWFPNMGAYTSVTSTEFNGFPKPEEIILEDTSQHQLPEPEDFDKKLWPENLKYVSVVKTPN
jgi:diaminopimelate decarboxylase